MKVCIVGAGAIDGAAKGGRHRISMPQDPERGRAIEIDALPTAVRELGRGAVEGGRAHCRTGVTVVL